MDKIVIVGTNEFAEYIYKAILKDKVAEVSAFATLKAFKNLSEWCGLPVYALEDLADEIDMDNHQVLIAVGYTEMNARRERTYNLCKQLRYRIYTYISPRAYVDCDLEAIGEGSIIMPRAILSPNIRVGVCNVFNSGAGLGHNGECGDFNWFSGRVCTGGNVRIGSKTFLGMCCVISNGVEIADETFVGVCSYVTSNTQKGLAYIGTPAKNTKNMKSKIVVDFV